MNSDIIYLMSYLMLKYLDIEATSGSITNIEIEDASENNSPKYPISNDILHKLQQEECLL